MAWGFTVTCVAGLAALLWAETNRPAWRRPAKMVASSAFVAVALSLDAWDAAFGRWMLVGLALSWVGDLFLTYRGRPAFLGGLVAFLVAHVAYIVAFLVRGVAGPLWPTGLVMLLVGVIILRWLRPHVDGQLRLPVTAYVVAITAMVLAAAATAQADADWRIPVGAVAFCLSDVAVARDRFVAPGVVNRIWGLPLYYGAQLLFAWSAGA
jgi:uncharacterized membrane protein YhhN